MSTENEEMLELIRQSGGYELSNRNTSAGDCGADSSRESRPGSETRST